MPKGLVTHIKFGLGFVLLLLLTITVEQPITSSAATTNSSSTSASDAVPPAAPTNFKATKTDLNTVRLTWTTPTDNTGVTGYNIERSADGSIWNTVTQNITQTSYTDSSSDLKPSVAYTYRVEALDATGNKSDFALAKSNVWQEEPATTSQPKTVAVDQASSSILALTGASLVFIGVIMGFIWYRLRSLKQARSSAPPIEGLTADPLAGLARITPVKDEIPKEETIPQPKSPDESSKNSD